MTRKNLGFYASPDDWDALTDGEKLAWGMEVAKQIQARFAQQAAGGSPT